MYGWVQRARRNFMEVQQADTQQKLNVCLYPAYSQMVEDFQLAVNFCGQAFYFDIVDQTVVIINLYSCFIFL